MDIIAAIAILSVLFVAGLTPWWIAGRHIAPATDRVALNELGFSGIVTTLRSGANMFVPAHPHTRA